MRAPWEPCSRRDLSSACLESLSGYRKFKSFNSGPFKISLGDYPGGFDNDKNLVGRGFKGGVAQS